MPRSRSSGGTTKPRSADDKRRVLHNAAEQRRSQRINHRIEEMRGVMARGGVTVRQNKYDILCTSADYMRLLQYERNVLISRLAKQLNVDVVEVLPGSTADIIDIPGDEATLLEERKRPSTGAPFERIDGSSPPGLTAAKGRRATKPRRATEASLKSHTTAAGAVGKSVPGQRTTAPLRVAGGRSLGQLGGAHSRPIIPPQSPVVSLQLSPPSTTGAGSGAGGGNGSEHGSGDGDSTEPPILRISGDLASRRLHSPLLRSSAAGQNAAMTKDRPWGSPFGIDDPALMLDSTLMPAHITVEGSPRVVSPSASKRRREEPGGSQPLRSLEPSRSDPPGASGDVVDTNALASQDGGLALDLWAAHGVDMDELPDLGFDLPTSIGNASAAEAIGMEALARGSADVPMVSSSTMDLGAARSSTTDADMAARQHAEAVGGGPVKRLRADSDVGSSGTCTVADIAIRASTIPTCHSRCANRAIAALHARAASQWGAQVAEQVVKAATVAREKTGAQLPQETELARIARDW